jgi:hypothetical protein
MVPFPPDRAKDLCDDHLGKLKKLLINLLFELVNNCFEQIKVRPEFQETPPYSKSRIQKLICIIIFFRLFYRLIIQSVVVQILFDN